MTLLYGTALFHLLTVESAQDVCLVSLQPAQTVRYLSSF